MQPGWRRGHPVPNTPWGPVWHFPPVPAGKPGGTSQEGSVLLGHSVLGCASLIQGCPFAKWGFLSPPRGQQESTEKAGWTARPTRRHFFSSQILLVQWPRAEGRAEFGASQRTFLLMPPVVAAVLGSRLHAWRGGLSGRDARQLSLYEPHTQF